MISNRPKVTSDNEVPNKLTEPFLRFNISALGMTVKEVSEATGINTLRITNAINDKVKNPEFIGTIMWRFPRYKMEDLFTVCAFTDRLLNLRNRIPVPYSFEECVVFEMSYAPINQTLGITENMFVVYQNDKPLIGYRSDDSIKIWRGSKDSPLLALILRERKKLGLPTREERDY